MTAGSVGSYPEIKDMCLGDYFDKDGGRPTSISDNPLIVLQADNSNKIRILRQALIKSGVHFTDFTNTMVLDTALEQRAATRNTPEAELEYYGVTIFGRVEELNSLTKKFSLRRG